VEPLEKTAVANFYGKLRDELLDAEIFHRPKTAKKFRPSLVAFASPVFSAPHGAKYAVPGRFERVSPHH
jgi:hypothetical protein